jgi:tetratricopeptide (TPR) repeat protein
LDVTVCFETQGLSMKPGIQSLQKKAYAARLKGKWLQAIKHLEVLCKVYPNSIDFALDLADCYIHLEDFQSAVRIYARAFELAPSDPSLAASFGGALLRSGKPHEAKTLLLHCLDLDPKHMAARINLGGVYQALGDLKACLNNALEAVSIDPTNAVAFNNLGSALSDLSMWAEAKHAFETALMLQPTQLDALINVASCEAKLCNHAKAIKHYEEVLLKLPFEAKQRAEAIRFFASFQYLQLGELKKGWGYYEGGFSTLVPITGARTPKLQTTVPVWNGQDLNNKNILIWREQGIGDEILFASCLPDFLDKHTSTHCSLLSEPRLTRVFKRSFPKVNVFGQLEEVELTQFDYHLPLGSLMRVFRDAIEKFESPKPYLVADKYLRLEFERRLSPYRNEGKRLVGMCWRSGLLGPNRNGGYTNIDDWEFIRDTAKDFAFVSLQYGNAEPELLAAEAAFGVKILRWDDIDLKNDMERVFALVSCLDVVVTVGTSVSAIAGSLGVPTIYLVKRGWLFLGQEKFPWFNNFHELVADGDEPVASKLKDVPSLIHSILDGD